MKTTFRGDIPPYLGAVLTDRFEAEPRPITVCGLTRRIGGYLEVALWEWHWDPGDGPVNHGPLREEIQECRLAVLDAPQGLAKPGQPRRQCEIISHSSTPTPDHRNRISTLPGYVNSSLDFFLALQKSGMPLDQPDSPHAVVEFYPDFAWKQLAGPSIPLSRRETPQGTMERLEILKLCGVLGIPLNATSTELDACLGALIAAAIDNRAGEISAEMVGTRAYLDEGVIREGRLAVPRPGNKISALLRTTLLGRQGMAFPDQMPEPVRIEEQKKAQNLLDQLVTRFQENKPALATYDYAYEFIFGTKPRPWLAHIHPAKVLNYAAQTHPHDIEGFGKMRLDTFTVSKGTRKPGREHWQAGLGYDERAWHKAFKSADLLK